MNGYDDYRNPVQSYPQQTDMQQNRQGIYRSPSQGMTPVSTSGSEFTSLPAMNFDNPEMRGSMQAILSNNIGEFVVVEFLIGTERVTRRQGILYAVGTSYVTLYDEFQNIYIVADIFSIKFVYFYYPGQRPPRNFNNLTANNGF